MKSILLATFHISLQIWIWENNIKYLVVFYWFIAQNNLLALLRILVYWVYVFHINNLFQCKTLKSLKYNFKFNSNFEKKKMHKIACPLNQELSSGLTPGLTQFSSHSLFIVVLTSKCFPIMMIMTFMSLTSSFLQ